MDKVLDALNAPLEITGSGLYQILIVVAEKNLNEEPDSNIWGDDGAN